MGKSPKIRERWIGRETEVRHLRSLIRTGNPSLNINIFGGAGTGKTEIVKHICASSPGLRTAYIDCSAITNVRQTLESIMNQLGGTMPSEENNYGIHAVCDRGCSTFALTWDKLEDPERACVIILDNIDFLRTAYGHMRYGLLNLARVATNGPNAILIFIGRGTGSRHIDEELNCHGYFVNNVNFPSYTPDTVEEILNSEEFRVTGANISKPQWKSLMKYLNDHVRQSTSNFKSYFPIHNALKCAIKDQNWSFGACKKLISSTARDLFLLDKVDKTETRVENEYLSSLPGPKSNVAQFALPYVAKILLLAGYICAYNPPKADMRVFGFAKVLGRRKKRKEVGRQGNMKDHLSQKVIGSQTFDLERLICIFHGIWEQQVSSSAKTLTGGGYSLSKTQRSKTTRSELVISQVEYLVSLGMLAKGAVKVKEPVKLKCLIGHEYANDLAKNNHFPLSEYIFTEKRA